MPEGSFWAFHWSFAYGMTTGSRGRVSGRARIPFLHHGSDSGRRIHEGMFSIQRLYCTILCITYMGRIPPFLLDEHTLPWFLYFHHATSYQPKKMQTFLMGSNHVNICSDPFSGWRSQVWPIVFCFQWEFQDPKMEVPTIYKPYFSGLCQGISPQFPLMIWWRASFMNPNADWMFTQFSVLISIFTHPLSSRRGPPIIGWVITLTIVIFP